MASQRVEREEEDLVRMYLKDIGQYALLTKDDEARLAQAMEAGKAAQIEAGVQRAAARGEPGAQGRQVGALVDQPAPGKFFDNVGHKSFTESSQNGLLKTKLFHPRSPAARINLSVD